MLRPILCYRNREAARQAVKAIEASGRTAGISEQPAERDSHLFAIEVDEEDEVAAVRTIESAETGGEDLIRCPACNSANVEYPASPMASPTMHIIDKLMDSFPPARHSFLCKACSHQWA